MRPLCLNILTSLQIVYNLPHLMIKFIVLTDIDLLDMNSALSTKFLLWALLMFCCPDPGWTTEAEEMSILEVKMTIIMDRMMRMEAEMVAKDERIAVLEATTGTLEKAVITKDAQLRGMVDQVMNPPFAIQCAYKNPWSVANSVITYDRLTTDEISGGPIYNVTGGLDINTGVFTVGDGFSGVWAVTYSLQSNQHRRDISRLCIRAPYK